MAAKSIILICLQVLFLQSALSQICSNQAAIGYAPGLGLGYDGLSSTYGYSVPELVALSKSCPYLVNRGIYFNAITPEIAQEVSSLAKYCPYLASNDLRYNGYSAQELETLSNTCPYLVNTGLTYGQWAAVNGYNGQDLSALASSCPYLVNRGLDYDGAPALNSYAAVPAISALNIAAPCAAPSLIAPTLAASAFSAPALGLASSLNPFNAPAFGLVAAPAIEISPTRGGAFSVSSGSAIPPIGISISSDNVYEGALEVAGEVPFVGTVMFENVLPTAGSGAVNHACGNGRNAMSSDSAAYVAATPIAPAAAIAPVGLAASGFGFRGCPGRFGML